MLATNQVLAAAREQIDPRMIAHLNKLEEKMLGLKLDDKRADFLLGCELRDLRLLLSIQDESLREYLKPLIYEVKTDLYSGTKNIHDINDAHRGRILEIGRKIKTNEGFTSSEDRSLTAQLLASRLCHDEVYFLNTIEKALVEAGPEARSAINILGAGMQAAQDRTCQTALRSFIRPIEAIDPKGEIIVPYLIEETSSTNSRRVEAGLVLLSQFKSPEIRRAMLEPFVEYLKGSEGKGENIYQKNMLILAASIAICLKKDEFSDALKQADEQAPAPRITQRVDVNDLPSPFPVGVPVTDERSLALFLRNTLLCNDLVCVEIAAGVIADKAPLARDGNPRLDLASFISLAVAEGNFGALVRMLDPAARPDHRTLAKLCSEILEFKLKTLITTDNPAERYRELMRWAELADVPEQADFNKGSTSCISFLQKLGSPDARAFLKSHFLEVGQDSPHCGDFIYAYGQWGNPRDLEVLKWLAARQSDGIQKDLQDTRKDAAEAILKLVSRDKAFYKENNEFLQIARSAFNFLNS